MAVYRRVMSVRLVKLVGHTATDGPTVSLPPYPERDTVRLGLGIAKLPDNI